MKTNCLGERCLPLVIQPNAEKGGKGRPTHSLTTTDRHEIMAGSDTMYMKMYHEDGLMMTAKSPETKSWENEPDEVIECASSQDVKDVIKEFDLYELSHRGKTGDQRGKVKPGQIFRTMSN